MKAFSHHTLSLLPNGSPVLLNTRGLPLQHSRLTFPFCGSIHGLLCEHTEACVLCMTCLVNASLEVGQSAPVLIVWPRMCLCIVILSRLTYLRQHFLAPALPLFSGACYSLVYLSQGERELLIQLSSAALVHLWKAWNERVWSGSLCFVLFNHVRPY